MSIEPGNRVEQDPCDFVAFGPFGLLVTARRLERDGIPADLGGCALDVLIALVAFLETRAILES